MIWPEDVAGQVERIILDLQAYLKLRPMLYHGTARSNLPCIQHERVLYSAAILAPHHCHGVRSREQVVKRGDHDAGLRDQQKLQQGHVEYRGGWGPRELLSAINGRVFFWPGDQDDPNRYGRKFADAYRGRGQTPMMLRIAFLDLLQPNPGTPAHFCKFNSGAPRTTAGRKSPRGPDTFQTAEEWHGPPSRVAEVSFVGKVVLPQSAEVWDQALGWRKLWHRSTDAAVCRCRGST